jgi:hypothetical protein
MEECAMSNEIMIPLYQDTSELNDASRREAMRRICHVLGISPEDLALLRAMTDRLNRVEGQCKTVTNRCGSLENVLKMACCPANMLFSQVTINRVSHQNQVNVVTPVTGLGGDIVDSFPVPPGKKIRLIQARRPGYTPVNITVALNLANNGTNYLDIVVRFYVSTSEKELGENLGSEYRGFQFFNNDGIPTPLPFPLYLNNPLTIGSEEYLIIELEHTGTANNLTSAFASAFVNNAGWFAACGIDTTNC